MMFSYALSTQTEKLEHLRKVWSLSVETHNNGTVNMIFLVANPNCPVQYLL